MKTAGLFAGLALAAFALATFGFDVFARVTIAGEPVGRAASGHLHDAGLQPVGTLMLLTPFLLLALIGAAAARRGGRRTGLILFAAGAAALLALYFLGFEGAQRAMQAEEWTAAALSVGLLPFLAVPLLLILAVAALAAVRTRRKRVREQRS